MMINKERFLFLLVSLFGVTIAGINTLLIIKLFGFGVESDIILMSQSILGVLILFSTAGIEQALLYFTKIRNDFPSRVNEFLMLTTIFALLAGCGLAFLCYFLKYYIINVFSPGFSQSNKAGLNLVLMFSLAQLVLFPVSFVFKAIYNERGRYFLSYFVSIVSHLVVSFTLLVCVFFGIYTSLVFSQMVLVFCILQGVFFLFLSPFRAVRLNFSDGILRNVFICMIRNSFKIKIGHLIYASFTTILINSALTHLPSGSFSIYQSAKRVSDAISAVSLGPYFNAMQSRVYMAWVNADLTSFKRALLGFVYSAPLIFLVGTFIVWFFSYLITPFLGVKNDRVFVAIFLCASLWNFVVIIEAVAVVILTAANKGYDFIIVNALFVINLYFALNFVTSDKNLYDIPLYAAFVQGLSLIIYSFVAVYHIKRRSFHAAKGQYSNTNT